MVTAKTIEMKTDFERITGYVSQSYELENDAELADWRHRMCGAVALYGSFVRLGLDAPPFSEYLDTLLEHGCYREGDGWIQPYQARFARDMGGLRAVSLTLQHNKDDGIEQSITAMMDSDRLPSDLSAPEVGLFRDELHGLHDMRSAVQWLCKHPEWLMIASVEPGYVSKNSRHQLLIQSDGLEAFAIDSAGSQSLMGTIFRLDEQFYRHATGNCIFLSQPDGKAYIEDNCQKVPYIAYKEPKQTFNGGQLHHVDMLRTPGILDAMLVTPEATDPASLPLVIHVQGVRYQERAIGEASTPYEDDFYLTFGNTMIEAGVAFTRLGIHGVGSAGGELTDESIDTRADALNDYIRVLSSLGFSYENMTISAQSQGCLVAIRALAGSALPVRKLSLVSPVLFSEDAEQASFGPEYTQELRKSANYKHSLVPERIEQITLKGVEVTITWMENDSPIPIPNEIRVAWDRIADQYRIPINVIGGHYHNFALESPKTREELEAGAIKPLSDLNAVSQYAKGLLS